jgi:hypothetical protein
MTVRKAMAALQCWAGLLAPVQGAESQPAPDPTPATAALKPIQPPPAPESAKTDEAGPKPDKSQYHLFNPTPRASMREMVTDRPDKTESPYTVDAGHFQFELDFVNHTRDHDRSDGADTRVTSYAVLPVNLKVGLLNQVDLQLMLDTWNRVKTEDRVAGTVTRQSGFGDVTPRLKINLWGNDGGATAMAVMPFVKIPTNQDHLGNEAVEGGIILPLAIELPLGFDLGLMTEFDFNRNEANLRYHPEFINSLTVGHDLIGKLGGFIEFFSQVSADDGADWIGTIDLGLTYELTPNLRLDGGVSIGVTHAADDLNPFIGLSFRF